MNWLSGILIAVSVWLLFAMVWDSAHVRVMHECQRIGAFYVGDKTFDCKERK